MAFENLAPHQAFILAERQAGRTLTQVADALAERFQVETTAASLSRYLKTVNVAGAPPARALSREEERLVEIVGLVMEHGNAAQDQAETTRLAIEHLAGKVAGLGSRFTALEEAVKAKAAADAEVARTTNALPTPAAVDPALVSKIWGRALLWVSLVWLAASGLGGGLVWWWIARSGR